MRIACILAAATIAAAAPAGAQVLDTFNRPNAPTLGSNWTNVVGSGEVINNTARALNATPFSPQLATFNGGFGDTVSFDIAVGAGDVQYAAAVLNYSAANNYFIKVQSNSGGVFDFYGFYTGNNVSNGTFARLSSTFTSGNVVASILGSVATLRVTPTGGATQVYTFDYGVDFAGTGIGLGFLGDTRVDNFGGQAAPVVPEPATWAMMLVGVGAIGAAARRRTRVRFATA